MFSAKTGLAALVTIFLSATAMSTSSQAVITETATGAVLLNELRSTVDGMIDKARDSGDFILWRALISVRDGLDAFERTSKSLLNTAFSELGKAQQDFFRKVDAQVDNLKKTKEITLDELDTISAQWTQILSTMIVAEDKPIVLQYSPRVIMPEGEEAIRMRVLGPNFAKAEAKLVKPDVKATSPLEYAADFQLKRVDLPFADSGSVFYARTLDYKEDPKAWVFNKARTNRELSFWLLPRKLAEYRITTRVLVPTRETTTRAVNLGQFRGRNSRIPRAVPVPDAALGWRIDLTRRNEIRLLQGGADRGRCEGIEDNSITENGLVMFARVDNRDRGPFRRDAWTDCSISLPLYRIPPPQEADGPAATGDLSWHKDVPFKVPENLKSMKIEMVIFDKRQPTFTGAGSDRYFDIRSEGGLILIKPRPPRDL